jgi:crotonobetainyl-CoA:carnitine CoA-transferase CaiB-like acyl-CoA transferase
MSAFVDTRVLDFSRHFAAAMAAMHLADFGAEVIKIDPTTEDRGRAEPGYLAWNRNKKRLALDLADPADLAAAKTLIADADVVIFDSAPGVLAPLGLDAETLRAGHPRLVHAWAPPYGETGRWSGLPPSHTLLSALTSIARRQPSYTGSPVHLVTPQAYYGQANLLAAAIGAALFDRERSGVGRAVTVTGLHGAAEVTTPTQIEDAPAPVIWGSPKGGAPNYRLYRCADGEHLFFGALFTAPYMRALDVSGVLGEVLAHPDVSGDIDAALVAPGALITMALLEAWFGSKPRDECIAIMHAADVPCGPVNTREAWFASPTVAANHMRLQLDHPELGPVTMPGVALQLGGSPAVETRLSAPATLAGIAARAPPPAPRSGRRSPLPLAGIKILDLGVIIAGAYGPTILANWGAEVIKVEGPEGDVFRSSITFWSFNRGQRGLCLDLKHEAARQVLYEMAAQADIVLDNYRHGVRERLGITYEALRRINPRIITHSITGYGDDASRLTLAALDPILQAESGLQQAQGGYGGEPVMHAIPPNDVHTASLSAFAVVAALCARERTGLGQEIRASLAATSLMTQFAQFVRYPGGPEPAMGERDCVGSCALERFYECQDGWIAIACLTPRLWEALRTALGLSAMDPQSALREPRHGALADAVARALKPLTCEAALARLEAAGAPAAPALTGPEIYDDAYLAQNGYLDAHARPGVGVVRTAKAYAKFDGDSGVFPCPAPLLGEHTVEVLAEYGLSPERVGALIASGAVIQP